VLVAAALQLSVCHQAQASDNPFPESSTAFSKLQEIKQRASDLTMKAMDFMGIRYKRGGSTPENGLDCSGFVRLVFKDALGANLPRTAAEISRVGENIDQKDLQPGDLVFYNTLRRGFSHVGIYLGDNKFIHSLPLVVRCGLKAWILPTGKIVSTAPAALMTTTPSNS
jgi:cell wall-associated NlpC family hydrolase